MKILISSTLFLILVLSCKSTSNVEVTPYNFSYQDNWKYFTLEDTITINVVEHLPAEAFCGNMAFASLTIAITERKDTIRIINLCNMDTYNQNDIVQFIPADKPEFFVNLPYSTIHNSETNELQPGFYDLNILETTYGYALR